MKVRRQRRPRFVGTETSRVVTYALSGVAKELARLLKHHLARRRRMLTRRGETGVSKDDVARLLYRALSRAILRPRGDVVRAARQRSALLFALAAADLPSNLQVSGIPTELRRQRKRRRR
jgi:hypothetical protein